MSGGGDTNTSTATTASDPFLTQAGQQTYNTGYGMLSPWLESPAYAVAGTNADHEMGFDLTRRLAQDTFSTARPTVNFGSLNAPFTPLGANDYQQFMNPYQNEVVNTTLNRMQDDQRGTLANIAGQAAAASPMAGSNSSAALQAASSNRNHGENVASTTAKLMSEGYNFATAQAMANRQMQNEMANANAGRYLQGVGMENTLVNDQAARQTSAIRGVLSAADAQRAVQQQAIDVPWQMFDRLIAMTPRTQGTSTTTSTTPDNSPSWWQQLGSLGLGLLGSAI